MIMIYWRWNKQKHNTAKFYTYIGEIKGYVYPNLVLQNSCTSYYYFDLAKEVSSSFFNRGFVCKLGVQLHTHFLTPTLLHNPLFSS